MPDTLPVAETSYQRALSDMAHLQGVWVSVSGQRRAEFLVAGHLFTMKFHDGALYMGTFDVDLDDSPPTMTMRIDEGPVKHKGHLALCIYELHNDMLRWCPGKPGSEERPQAFPSDEDEKALCLLFKREYARFHQ
jgi:uncharacterized protein (TIGR03067 family)